MPPHFHPLETDIKKPAKFTDPFCYEPHPLCLLAAKEVQEYIARDGRLLADASRGKMFGVLVVETDGGQLGYLAAFSGLLCGSNDWPLLALRQQRLAVFRTSGVRRDTTRRLFQAP